MVNLFTGKINDVYFDYDLIICCCRLNIAIPEDQKDSPSKTTLPRPAESVPNSADILRHKSRPTFLD